MQPNPQHNTHTGRRSEGQCKGAKRESYTRAQYSEVKILLFVFVSKLVVGCLFCFSNFFVRFLLLLFRIIIIDSERMLATEVVQSVCGI